MRDVAHRELLALSETILAYDLGRGFRFALTRSTNSALVAFELGINPRWRLSVSAGSPTANRDPPTAFSHRFNSVKVHSSGSKLVSRNDITQLDVHTP